MLTTLRQLHAAGPLSLPGMVSLLDAMIAAGLNLATLLRATARAHPERIALVDDRESLRYGELWRRVEVVAVALRTSYNLGPGRRVAVACRNHAAAITTICACSRLGAHVVLVNPEQSAASLLALAERQRFDLFVYDEELAPVVAQMSATTHTLSVAQESAVSLDGLAAQFTRTDVRLPPARTGEIVVLTSGTTGQPKAAGRKPSPLNVLPPFLALLARTNLAAYRSLYVATPIYHGYGLAMLLIGLALGAELYVTRRFEAARSCGLIARHRIAAVTLVPLQLQRMLRFDSSALASLRCVVAGSAPLSPALTRDALDRLGPILFNLYGTSEAGFAILAPPELLGRKPGTIGRPLAGVRTRIVGPAGAEVTGTRVGQLCISSAWTADGRGWIATGDLAYRDDEGDLTLCGRVDDMIVSGGENVYPLELEHVLQQHPDVEAVAVVGIPDSEFGQRLKAVVVPKRGVHSDEAALRAWLKPRVARYQMPAVVEFRAELPYTVLGKLDRRALRG
jgi:acyl-CoA synthetase (AMP-forming)/AMP-acid ligase II